MSRTNVQQTPLSFGPLSGDEREAGTPWRSILAAYQALRQTLSFVPPVADGPGDSADPGPRRRRAAAIPRAAAGGISHAQTKTITNTTRGGARFQWQVIVATYLHAVDQTVDPNHDADIRIGSEAPKQRCPFLYPA